MKSLLYLIFLAAFIGGCSTSKPLFTYNAANSNGINTFYIDGVSVASCETDCCYFSVSIDKQESIAGYGHLRVWFLYENLSESPVLIKPWTILKLSILDIETGKRFTNSPLTPNEVSEKISDKEAAENFLNFLGSAAQTIAVSSESSPAAKTQQQAEIVENALYKAGATSVWYDALRASYSSGILKTNTVFQNSSVNGYVYFPLQFGKDTFTHLLYKLKRYKCIIEVTTPNGIKEVEFIPADIE